MSRESSKSERTKQFIIEKSALVFNTKGYAGTSLSDLTEATGLTKGSIYFNFSDKDDVALNAFRYNVDFIMNAFVEPLKAAGTPLEQLFVYPAVYRSIYQDILARGGCPILNTLVEADDTHEALHRAALKAVGWWKKGIIDLVRKGIHIREIREDVDPGNVAELIIALFEGGGMLTKATGDESFILNALDHVEFILESLKLNEEN